MRKKVLHMSEKDARNLEQPLKVQGANPKTIQCKDCVFRDRTLFNHKGETILLEL